MTTTTVTPTSQAFSVANFASGSFTSDGNATIVKLGFTARRVEAVNSTDTIVWTKLEGMAAANCVKVTSTTQSIETSSDILINTDKTITLSATLVGSSKAISWTAFA
jgi:hypothetical protein